MTQYVVLLPGDESAWANATEEQRSETYARHGSSPACSASGATRSPGAAR